MADTKKFKLLVTQCGVAPSPTSEPKDEPSGPTPSTQDHSVNAPQLKPLKPAVSATNSVDIFTAKEGQGQMS